MWRTAREDYTNQLQRLASPEINIGQWDTIHKLAVISDNRGTAQERLRYLNDMKELVKTHYCGDCRTHGTAYLGDPRTMQMIVSGDRNACFKVSWGMHNDVNSRTGKKPLPYQEAFTWYHPRGPQ